MKRPNGMGSITKIKNRKLRKPYIIRAAAFYDELSGKMKRIRIGSAATQKEALEILHRYNARNLNLESNDITLKDLFLNWQESKHFKNIKTEATKERYIKDFIDVLEIHFKRTFNSLEYKDYQSEIDKYAKNKGKNVITTLRNIYDEAIKNKIVREDVSKLLTSSDIITKTIERVVFPSDLVQKLWIEYEKSNSTEIAMLLILFYTGMRSIDLKRIENHNIFLEERYLITGSKTKAGMNRKIPLHHLIYPVVKKYKNNGKYLFPELKDTGRLNYFFKKKVKELDYNISCNIHSIRHTFITRMQQLNISVSKIRNIVGHEDDNVTDGVYTHWSIKDLRDAINRLNY